MNDEIIDKLARFLQDPKYYPTLIQLLRSEAKRKGLGGVVPINNMLSEMYPVSWRRFWDEVSYKGMGKSDSKHSDIIEHVLTESILNKASLQSLFDDYDVPNYIFHRSPDLFVMPDPEQKASLSSYASVEMLKRMGYQDCLTYHYEQSAIGWWRRIDLEDYNYHNASYQDVLKGSLKILGNKVSTGFNKKSRDYLYWYWPETAASLTLIPVDTSISRLWLLATTYKGDSDD